MGKKIFLLGLPGSGKSTVARYLQGRLEDQKWKTTWYNDYDILYNWFLKEPKPDQFGPTERGGFDVYDLIVFDTALQELERQVQEQEQLQSDEQGVAIIEFARNDYYQALHCFTANFLQDAYFLFLDTEIATCKERIQYRSLHPNSLDDHYVSEYIFERYYDKYARDYNILSCLNSAVDINGEPYVLKPENSQVIKNTQSVSLQELFQQIKIFVAFFNVQEADLENRNTTGNNVSSRNSISTHQNTEPLEPEALSNSVSAVQVAVAYVRN